MQVNAIGTAQVAADNAVSGVPRGKIVSGVLGDLVCRYTYDGLGRLILKETPINTGVTSLQRKDLYYDGVRRIQEVITRLRDPVDLPIVPTPTTEPEEMGNDELVLLLREGGEPQPMTIIELPPSSGPLGDIVAWTDREYVYGPAYVDEFVCQLDRDGRIIYMLQDGNYNVVALVSGGCSSGGGSGGGGSGNCGTGVPPVGTVLEQYTYDPYGTVLAAENLDRDPVTGRSRHAVNRVGFQGLFFERYDGSYTEPSIAPGVAGLYSARNRFYSPILGRFIQRDPNETGIPIIAALARNGQAMGVLLGGFNGQGLYGDGMNLYLYAGANPVMNTDPLGKSITSMLYGQKVHREIGNNFKMTYGAGGYYDKSINTILRTGSMFGYYRPDLVLPNPGGGEVWEIKSVEDAVLGASTVSFYSGILNSLDPANGTWVPGSASSYTPPPILDLGAGVIAIVFPPVGGVITYTVIDPKPIVALIVAYGLCRLEFALAEAELETVLIGA